MSLIFIKQNGLSALFMGATYVLTIAQHDTFIAYTIKAIIGAGVWFGFQFLYDQLKEKNKMLKEDQVFERVKNWYLKLIDGIAANDKKEKEDQQEKE
jgi:uncharacterized membrane protein